MSPVVVYGTTHCPILSLHFRDVAVRKNKEEGTEEGHNRGHHHQLARLSITSEKWAKFGLLVLRTHIFHAHDHFCEVILLFI